ncbi:Nitrogen regulation protein NIFR3 [Staphylococcus aureus]|nr:Nitrogen regulation protein NIFR3 [Staphylococcus aureus]SBB90196.1 Nitrogen regulation protein NIFR3 [Staphylococcus aureus]
MKMRLQQAFFNSSQGPQHREIGFPISTDNASWGVGPNTEKLDFQFLQTMQVGVWAPTKRISKRNSTGNASWGVGPNTEAYDKSAYDNVQVGLVQR